jgi:hypothetical protein
VNLSVSTKVADICIVLMLIGQTSAELFLPGMQPMESGIEFAKVQQCRMCHSETENGTADPFFSWQSSMMSQAYNCESRHKGCWRILLALPRTTWLAGGSFRAG